MTPTSCDSLTIQAPDSSPNDEASHVRVSGADPGETVEFEASMVGDDGGEWRSLTHFTADENGIVDLTEQAPTSGGYDGVEPMGWLWSMSTDSDDWFPRLETDSTVSIDLRATAGDRTAERTISRRLYDERITTKEVTRDGLVGTMFYPSGEGPHPAVIELHGGGGRQSVRTAKLLASKGYVTFALEYVGDANPLPDELERVPLSYVDDAAQWLLNQPAVSGPQLGVVGESQGGELALLLGARFDWVGAVVTYAGSGVVWSTHNGEPAWIHDGQPVPHITTTDPPAERLEAGIDEETIQRAMPAVESTAGPILLVTGGDDKVVPARRLANLVIDRLETAGFEHAFEHRTYDDAGHLIPVPYTPSADPLPTGGTDRGTARAAVDSWPRALEYLERGLGS